MASRGDPYVGPSPFTRADKLIFFGRESETNKLFSLVKANQAVLFYSQSGAGKTSLLNAGVLPLLEEEGHDFGVARVGGELPKGINPDGIRNIFVFNALLSLQGERPRFDPETLGRMSLQDFLRAHPNPKKREGFYPLRVIIFDQFEEIFTSFPDFWTHQEKFFVDVCKALTDDPLLHVVFAMREEHLASLDPFAGMLPAKMQRRFRLERLRAASALDAVEKPLAIMGRSFKPGATRKLVDNLLQVPIKSFDGKVVDKSGEFVEPVQLQIVCQSLWESVKRRPNMMIEAGEVEKWDVDKALSKYYADCLERVAEQGVNEGRLRLWFERELITSIGTRGTVFMQGGMAGGLSERAVKMLEELRLIRPEPRAGATWYELTHDRFIGPILKSNQRWREQREGGATLQKLETRAKEWERGDKQAGELLTGDELRDVELWLEAHDIRDLQSDLVRDYIRESKANAGRLRARESKRRFIWMTVAAFAAFAFAVFTFVTLLNWRRALAREQKAEQITKGNQAARYATEKGKEYDALRLGIEAVRPTASAGEPPEEARGGLLTALTKVGNKVWLRECVGPVERLDFSPDGELLLSVSNDRFHVWDAATGKHRYHKPVAGVGTVKWRQLDFSPDNRFLFALSEPLQSEVKQGKLSQEQTEPETPDNSGERIVLILDARTGEPIHSLEQALKEAGGMRVSRDGSRVLAETLKGRVIIVDTKTGGVRSPFPEERQQQWSQFDLSNNRLVADGGDSQIELWDTDSGNLLSTINLGVAKQTSDDIIRSSPDGKLGLLSRIVPGSRQQVVTVVWDDATGQKLPGLPFRDEVGDVAQVTFTPDSRAVVIVGSKQAVVHPLFGEGGGSRSLPEGNFVRYEGVHAFLAATDGDKQSVSAWNVWSGEVRSLLETTEYKIKGGVTGISTNLSRVATTGEDNVTLIWNLAEPLDFEKLSADQLLLRACEKLRYQEEYQQVETLCGR